MRVALSIVESKWAAIHFEMQVAAHIATKEVDYYHHITIMLNGIKMAILVQAPAVCQAFDNHEEDSGGVPLHTTIRTAYRGLINIIGISWQGTVLYGQYQLKGFADKLWDLLKKSQYMFTDVITRSTIVH